MLIGLLLDRDVFSFFLLRYISSQKKTKKNVATTTEGAPCRPGGWTSKSASLCVLLYRSKTLAKGSWVTYFDTC